MVRNRALYLMPIQCPHPYAAPPFSLYSYIQLHAHVPEKGMNQNPGNKHPEFWGHSRLALDLNTFKIQAHF